MAKFFDEGSKELPTNRIGIALLSLLIKLCCWAPGDRWARSLATAAGLGRVHVGFYVWSVCGTGLVVYVLRVCETRPSAIAPRLLEAQALFCLQRGQYVQW